MGWHGDDDMLPLATIVLCPRCPNAPRGGTSVQNQERRSMGALGRGKKGRKGWRHKWELSSSTEYRDGLHKALGSKSIHSSRAARAREPCFAGQPPFTVNCSLPFPPPSRQVCAISRLSVSFGPLPLGPFSSFFLTPQVRGAAAVHNVTVPGSLSLSLASYSVEPDWSRQSSTQPPGLRNPPVSPPVYGVFYLIHIRSSGRRPTAWCLRLLISS